MLYDYDYDYSGKLMSSRTVYATTFFSSAGVADAAATAAQADAAAIGAAAFEPVAQAAAIQGAPTTHAIQAVVKCHAGAAAMALAHAQVKVISSADLMANQINAQVICLPAMGLVAETKVGIEDEVCMVICRWNIVVEPLVINLKVSLPACFHALLWYKLLNCDQGHVPQLTLY